MEKFYAECALLTLKIIQKNFAFIWHVQYLYGFKVRKKKLHAVNIFSTKICKRLMLQSIMMYI